MQRLCLILSFLLAGGLCLAQDEMKAMDKAAQAAREEAAKARAELARATAAKDAKEAAAKAAEEAKEAAKQAREAKDALAKASPEHAADLSAALERAVEKAQATQDRARAAKAAADSYDATRARDAAVAAAREKTEANREFLGVKFNFGFGAVFMSDRVDEAQVVGEGEKARVRVTRSSSKRPAMLLEAHRLLDVKGPRSEPIPRRRMVRYSASSV